MIVAGSKWLGDGHNTDLQSSDKACPGHMPKVYMDEKSVMGNVSG